MCQTKTLHEAKHNRGVRHLNGSSTVQFSVVAKRSCSIPLTWGEIGVVRILYQAVH